MAQFEIKASDPEYVFKSIMYQAIDKNWPYFNVDGFRGPALKGLVRTSDSDGKINKITYPDDTQCNYRNGHLWMIDCWPFKYYVLNNKVYKTNADISFAQHVATISRPLLQFPKLEPSDEEYVFKSIMYEVINRNWTKFAFSGQRSVDSYVLGSTVVTENNGTSKNYVDRILTSVSYTDGIHCRYKNGKLYYIQCHPFYYYVINDLVYLTNARASFMENIASIAHLVVQEPFIKPIDTKPIEAKQALINSEQLKKLDGKTFELKEKLNEERSAELDALILKTISGCCDAHSGERLFKSDCDKVANTTMTIEQFLEKYNEEQVKQLMRCKFTHGSVCNPIDVYGYRGYACANDTARSTLKYQFEVCTSIFECYPKLMNEHVNDGKKFDANYNALMFMVNGISLANIVKDDNLRKRIASLMRVLTNTVQI